MNGTVLVYSGGLDSTTLLYHLLNGTDENFPIHALTVNYGQRHKIEIMCAQTIIEDLEGVLSKGSLTHTVVDLTSITKLLGGSCLTDSSLAVPHGHYAADNMKSTVVPNRNMIMLSVAAGFAISKGCNRVAIGSHAGDHAVYPDCRPVFNIALQQCLQVCHYEPVQLIAPFANKTKTEIVLEGLGLGVPYEHTWSCYEGGITPCGLCGTCVERIQAFAENDEMDPLDYKESWYKVVLAAEAVSTGHKLN